MNKKLIVLMSFSIFLLISVNCISASSDISVKVVWDDANQVNARPNEIIANLLHDGEIIDNVKLNDANSWKATFEVPDDNENYEVKQETNLDSYSSDITGDVENGFVITNKFIKNELLSVTNNENILNDPIQDNATGDNETNSNTTNNETNTTTNSTTNNKTSTDENTTENITSTINKNTKNNSSSTIKKISDIKKPVKKNNNNTTDTQMKKTGLPIVVLVLAIFVVVFNPFSRRK